MNAMNLSTSNVSAAPRGLSRRRVWVTAGGLLAAAMVLGGCGSNPPAKPAPRLRPEPARKSEPKGPIYDGHLK